LFKIERIENKMVLKSRLINSSNPAKRKAEEFTKKGGK
jgi:hypothetical protein